VDHIVAKGIEGTPKTVASIPPDMMGLDIGPKTLDHFKHLLKDAKTILWNGPMGVFENPNFAQGTFALANYLAESKAFTVVGGGDSASAINSLGLADKIGHVSTGGGASLEFIEEGTLPGINALKYGVNW
jgi:phosphoglycerate kinase